MDGKRLTIPGVCDPMASQPGPASQPIEVPPALELLRGTPLHFPPPNSSNWDPPYIGMLIVFLLFPHYPLILLILLRSHTLRYLHIPKHLFAHPREVFGISMGVKPTQGASFTSFPARTLEKVFV